MPAVQYEYKAEQKRGRHMSKEAIGLEEQIISLFPDLDTEVYKGCVLKQSGDLLMIYPLYCSSDEYVLERMEHCERLGMQKGLSCCFHIVEHTNYHLSAVLTDKGCSQVLYGMVAELCLPQGEAPACFCRENVKCCARPSFHGKDIEDIIGTDGAVIGKMRREFLFVLNGGLLSDADLKELLIFSSKNTVQKILVNLPNHKSLPENYKVLGFQKAYLYRCYQRHGKSKNGFTK